MSSLISAVHRIIHHTSVKEVVESLLLEAVCPSCGDKDSYVSLRGDIDCPNKGCVNFKKGTVKASTGVSRGNHFLDYVSPPPSKHAKWGGPVFGNGKYFLSTQASSSSYSHPQQGGLPASKYSAWEVAIIDTTKPRRRGLIEVLADPAFSSLPHKSRWSSDIVVAPFLEVDKVQDIFKWMVKTFGKAKKATP